ncbi:MAG: cell division protein FtsQ/DivIB [Bilifractor sp.]|jgi:hypothetical protein
MANKGSLQRRKRRRTRNLVLICVIFGLAVFAGLFYTTDVEVVGNSRYTDAQIEEMVMTGVLSHNTVLMSLVHGKVHPDAPLISSIEVEYINRNKLRLNVIEKYPVGYIVQSGTQYYFDKDGLVLEKVEGTSSQDAAADEGEVSGDGTASEDLSGETASVSSSSSAASSSAASSAAGSSAASSAVSSSATGSSVTSDSATDGSAVDEASNPANVTPDEKDAASGNAGSGSEDGSSSDSSGSSSAEAEISPVREGTNAEDDSSNSDEQKETITPALTDVPLITGLDVGEAKVGEKLEVKDSSVFQTIFALTKLIDKLDIQPDSVEFDSSLNMTLHYENVRIQLGSDDLLEEKMTRAAAILPDLTGMSGVLHLENYSSDTENIIFDSDDSAATTGTDGSQSGTDAG